MIKVLEGPKPSVVSCPGCLAKLEYSHTDKLERKGTGEYGPFREYHIICPCCNEKISVDKKGGYY